MLQAVDEEVQKRLRNKAVDAGALQKLGLPTSNFAAVMALRVCMAFLLLLLGTAIWFSRQNHSVGSAEL